MRKINTLFLLLLLSNFVFAQKGINFETGTWAQIQEKAQKENKFIFVDAYTSWCGPCKWMAKNIFTNDTVAEFYNKHFVNAKIDMEKGEGIDLAKKYDVKFYPSYLFFDSKGELVHRSGSAKPVNLFLEDGENAINPKNQIITLQKMYEAGDNSETVIKNYAVGLSKLHVKNDELAVLFIKVNKPEELFTEENFTVIYSLAELDKKAFSFLVKNEEKYKDKLGDEKYTQAMDELFYSQCWELGKNKDEKKLNELIDVNRKFFPKTADKTGLKMRLIYLQAANNIEELFEVYEKYFNVFEKYIESNEYNNGAWFAFENITDKTKLETALNWANKSVDLMKDSGNMDTKANLEFKLEKYKEAKQTAIETKEILKKEGGDTKSMDVIIKKSSQKLK